jgi:hypothetical protein
MGRVSNRDAVFSSLALAAALALLNASVTFGNLWPTLLVRWNGGVSLELAACILGLIIARPWQPASKVARRWLAIFWVILVIGRYADVTTRSLYGRDVNLYWDLRLMPDVGAMFAFVAKPWLVAAIVGGLILVPLALYAPLRWAIDRVAEATNEPRTRRALVVLAGVAFLSSGAQALDARVPDVPKFETPVTAVIAKQAMQVFYEMTGAGLRSLPPPAPIQSDFESVDGADVMLIFVESYGAVSWDRPQLAAPLTAAREKFAADVKASGRGMVSGFVESTTFGGESWLAHISLLSGTEVRDQNTNVRLMAQNRDTLAKAFKRQGYRTVTIMPGLQHGWPEGSFYGFDEIYGAHELDYHGPSFGWWDVTDQYALAKVDEKEIAPQPRKPVFLFFPTISSHAPFTPAPPYQPDWKRVQTTMPYDKPELTRAWADQPDWTNLSPSYVKALNYAYAMFGGYLKLRAGRDLVMILIGDHQPPALVSGAGASWEVPMHIIASRPELLERLQELGLQKGLVPEHPAVARMDTLLQLLLNAFGSPAESD